MGFSGRALASRITDVTRNYRKSRLKRTTRVPSLLPAVLCSAAWMKQLRKRICPTGAPTVIGSNVADEWLDALVASMKLGGIDKLFFVSGFELAFLPEAIRHPPRVSVTRPNSLYRELRVRLKRGLSALIFPTCTL